MTVKNELFHKAALATLRTLSLDHDITAPAELQIENFHKFSSEQQAKMRGLVDSYALRHRYHNEALEPSFSEPDARLIFDGLEQARCEIYGSRHFAGVRANLFQRLHDRSLQLKTSEMIRRDDMPPSLAIELLAREAMLGHKLDETITAPALERWREALTPQAKAAFKALANSQSDQKKFSEAGKALLASFGLTKDQKPGSGSDSNNLEQGTDESQGSESSTESSGTDEGQSSEQQIVKTDQTGEESSASGDLSSEEIEALLTQGEQGDEKAAGPSDNDETSLSEPIKFADGYQIFTREFDEIIAADDLCDPEELHFLREQLDHQLERTKDFVSRLAHRLQRRLLAQQQRHWSFDEEDGILDAARLPRIVSNPSLPLSYKQESNTEFKETVVTLLIDNSGSMRGLPITTAAICSDILARTLERCGVKVEILGFTTRTWKGGQSRFKWMQEGRPPQPGRLNDLRHIIYKSADQPWRHARLNLGLMLRDGLLKENIDGEALLWASRRLKMRPEHRRILMVISDGAPVDDSTASANMPDYLDVHLHKVIARLQADRAIELLAIGIGHDVTRYYANSVTIGSAEDLGDTMVTQLSTLFTPSKNTAKTRVNNRKKLAL
ncbi:cobaltochelatase CobT-related protein [Aristophania vespae]|uniref:cobaltochelatase CobT-related protein n=1 Tax=Aristophania vespae TaxID=2697033 RepID=UPI00235110D7|nr:cobaltochelatase subunit CobT [Aristophania vespae]UMM63371.1 Aerobic cobaltochelatase subunit CobT [Aristophania vespae]